MKIFKNEDFGFTNENVVKKIKGTIFLYICVYCIHIGGLMGYIYINIFPKKLQFAAYGQFVLG